MRKGSDNDGSSQLVARGVPGDPLLRRHRARRARISRWSRPSWSCSRSSAPRDGGRENVLVRGVEPIALRCIDEVHIAEGRMFTPSAGEAVVGRGVVGPLRGRRARQRAASSAAARWKVVGIFDAGRLVVRERGVGRRARARQRRQAPVPVLRHAPARRRRRPTWRRSSGASTTTRATRSRRSRETDYYAKQAESANSLYVLVDRHRRAGRHRRRLRRRQHDVRRGPGAHGRDRHAARARLLARLDPARRSRSRRSALALLGFLHRRASAPLLLARADRAAARRHRLRRARPSPPTSSRCASRPAISSARWSSRSLIGIAGGLGPAWRAARLRPIEALRKA